MHIHLMVYEYDKQTSETISMVIPNKGHAGELRYPMTSGSRNGFVL